MRYAILTAGIIILTLTNVMFYFGGEPKRHLETTNIAPNCGLVNASSGDDEYHFKCGLTTKELATSPDIDDLSLSSERKCRIEINEEGLVDSLYCKKEIDDTVLTGVDNSALFGFWSCLGLDGFGGASENHTSLLNIFSDKTFQIKLFAKENSDSIWHVSDSVINGTYQPGKNDEFTFTPLEWVSDVIIASALTIKNAPKYMPIEKYTFKVNTLQDNKLDAVMYRNSHIATGDKIQCSKIIHK